MAGRPGSLSTIEAMAAGSGGNRPGRRPRAGQRPRAARPARVEETSAGGLVLDRRSPDARVVLIGRYDRRGRLVWSLPKGHLEAGETQEAAAVREVAEETGIRGRIVGPLGSIDFWFTADGRRVHKTVHHFLLLAEGGELSDEDVEVAEVAWVPLAEASARLAYATERALLARVPDVLADSA
jgi:8-oxo-dGTP pyrophosphatase MutT (NUDIX family)